MSTLVSPGIAVPVTDESQYASPGSGTIPLIILATRNNKIDPTTTFSDGIARYTKPEFAGKVVTVTSQREITQFFGTAAFARSGESVIAGAETSEYGLLAAYSYLGQGSLAYVLRANIDLAELDAVATEPSGPVQFGTFWLDANDSSFGVHEWDGARWTRQSVIVETKATDVAPTATAPNGEYAIAVIKTSSNVLVRYYRRESATWVSLNNAFTDTVTYAPHYAAPASPDIGDVWIKTTRQGGGINLNVYRSNIAGVFQFVTTHGVSDTYAAVDYIPQNGLSLPTISVLQNGQLQLLLLAATAGGFEILWTAANATAPITQAFITQNIEPTGVTADGKLWFNSNALDLDILRRGSSGWVRPAVDALIYSVTAPSTRSDASALELQDIWIDLSADARAYPSLKVWTGTIWTPHSNTDQTTESGVIFTDITDQTAVGNITALISTSVNPLLYPLGMLAVNMCQSANTVRRYNASAGAWRNAAENHADGAGSFGKSAQRRIITKAMQAAVISSEELRDESLRYTIITAPNYPELYDEMITLNSDRGETAFVIVDAPMNLQPSQVVQWVQGQNAAENGEYGLVNKNTYSGVFYPSARATTMEGDSTIVPASHIILYQIGFSDSISWPWFAAAGLTRGQVQNATAVGYLNNEGEFTPVSLNQGQRDILYINKVNPIANFTDEGVIVFGNKSLHPASSALDRINVARLVAYLRERFSVIGRPFIFEQNDEPTRERVKDVYEKFLFDMIAKRGVEDFSVVCDRSNNTSLRVSRNELWVDVAIIPTKSVEFIYIPIRLVVESSQL